MNIIGKNGKKIDSMEAWENLFKSPRKKHHWKPDRSAYSLADFILNRNGADVLQKRVEEAIGEAVTFEKAIPELEVSFDDFEHGREHDLGIHGRTASGRSLFVGIEAKVDESFGQDIDEAYQKAKAKRISGQRTNAPERIEQLLKMHFKALDTSIFTLRYQLLYATAGTVKAGADVSVLLIVVFKTSDYCESKSDVNFTDYIAFMEKTGATPLSLQTSGALGHKLVLYGKELICIHEHFDF